MSKMTKAQREDQREAAAELRELLTPGQTIRTADYAVRNTSYVRMYVIDKARHNGKAYIRDITELAARAMGDKVVYPSTGRGGLRYGGWGYSRQYMAVYSLGHALYPDGIRCAGDLKSKPRCASNDHTNGDPKGYSRAKGHVHSDGGYAFTQASL